MSTQEANLAMVDTSNEASVESQVRLPQRTFPENLYWHSKMLKIRAKKSRSPETHENEKSSQVLLNKDQSARIVFMQIK